MEDWEAMIGGLSTSMAYQELIQSLLEMQQRFFPDQSVADLQLVCEELVRPLKGWWYPSLPMSYLDASMGWFQFLVKCNIVERVNAIGVRNWRMNIIHVSERKMSSREHSSFDSIHFKVITDPLEGCCIFAGARPLEI